MRYAFFSLQLLLLIFCIVQFEYISFNKYIIYDLKPYAISTTSYIAEQERKEITTTATTTTIEAEDEQNSNNNARKIDLIRIYSTNPDDFLSISIVVMVLWPACHHAVTNLLYTQKIDSFLKHLKHYPNGLTKCNLLSASDCFFLSSSLSFLFVAAAFSILSSYMRMLHTSFQFAPLFRFHFQFYFILLMFFFTKKSCTKN